MHGLVRSALAAAAWMTLAVVVTVASAENDTDKTEPPAANSTPPAATNPPQPPATPEITVLAKHEVEGVLGRDVRGAADEDMGRIVDVLVDRAGQVRAAIIDFGGFLGVGSRKIAVDWGALHFPEPGKPGQRITLELNRDQVNTAPEYKDGKPVVVLGALGKLEPLPE
jgi:PRC-barrel domain